MNRRNLLSTAGLLALSGCGAFTSSTVNGVTTITVNVGQIDSWAQAFKNGANLILGLPGIAPLLGPAADIVAAVVIAVTTDIHTFDVAAGGKTTLTFDTTSIPNFVSSVLSDGQQIVGNIAKVLPSEALVGTVATYLNAIATVVSLFEGLLGVAPTAAPSTKMSEAAALAILHVPAK